MVGHIALACGGDVRKAMNSVELCVLSSPAADGVRKITLETAKELTQKSALRYDKDGDEHYDLLSAFQKSMRGSDPDAAVHYLARLLEAGDLPGLPSFDGHRLRGCGARLSPDHSHCQGLRRRGVSGGTAGSPSVPGGWSNFSQYRAEIKFRS